MELIEVITSKENLNRAYRKVVANKGAGGIDGMMVKELGDYIRENQYKIVTSLRNRTYMPKPVRRVYIPKANGKKRPLGIPTVLDRVIQLVIAQPISDGYEKIFSEYSYGLRPGRSTSTRPYTAPSTSVLHALYCSLDNKAFFIQNIQYCIHPTLPWSSSPSCSLHIRLLQPPH